MKVRNGFVSNSSSSSFLICGISDVDSINSVLMKNDIISDEITDIGSVLYSSYLRQRIEDTLKLGIYRNDNGEIYIGKGIKLDCNTIKVNEFKELISAVENALSDVDSSKIIVDYIEERYY